MWHHYNLGIGHAKSSWIISKSQLGHNILYELWIWIRRIGQDINQAIYLYEQFAKQGYQKAQNELEKLIVTLYKKIGDSSIVNENF